MNTENININFIRIVGELGASLGLNRSVGQIYGLLYMSDKPLSLDDLVSKLKMSKGSVSLNIRELERWEAVKKIWVSGSRKDFYEVNPDFINSPIRGSTSRAALSPLIPSPFMVAPIFENAKLISPTLTPM